MGCMNCKWLQKGLWVLVIWNSLDLLWANIGLDKSTTPLVAQVAHAHMCARMFVGWDAHVCLCACSVHAWVRRFARAFCVCTCHGGVHCLLFKCEHLCMRTMGRFDVSWQIIDKHNVIWICKFWSDCFFWLSALFCRGVRCSVVVVDDLLSFAMFHCGLWCSLLWCSIVVCDVCQDVPRICWLHIAIQSASSSYFTSNLCVCLLRLFNFE